MASRQELLQSIHPNMKLTQELFRKIYGYSVTTPEFADEALAKLESLGCSKARKYYKDWVRGYETGHNEMLRNVSAWYVDFCKNNERQVMKKRAKKHDIQNLTRSELTELCQRLLQEGIIEAPEQFVTLVQQDC